MDKLYIDNIAVKMPGCESLDALDRFIYEDLSWSGDAVIENMLPVTEELLFRDLVEQLRLSGDKQKTSFMSLLPVSEKLEVAMEGAELYACADVCAALELSQEKLNDKYEQVVIFCVTEQRVDAAEAEKLTRSILLGENDSLTSIGLLDYYGLAIKLSKQKSDNAIACIEGYAEGENDLVSLFNGAELEAKDLAYVDFSQNKNLDIQKQKIKQIDSLKQADLKEVNLTCAIGSSSSIVNLDRNGMALLSLIKSALSVYHRYIPGHSSWKKPNDIEFWNNSYCYLDQKSKTWFVESENDLRVALSIQSDLVGSQVLVSDRAIAMERPNKYFAHACAHLFVFSASCLEDFLTQLTELEESLGSIKERDLRYSAKKSYTDFLAKEDQLQIEAYRLALIAEDKVSLLNELTLIKSELPKQFAKKEEGKEFKTPKGSYFTTHALGDSGKVSFVFPGLGSSYVDLGRHIFHLFPSVFKESYRFTNNVGEDLQDEVLYPRTIEALSFKERRKRDIDIVLNLKDVGKTDTTYSCICSHVMTEVFKVHPDMAFGYSMGEANMMSALEIWKDPKTLEKRFQESDIFREKLHGEMKTVKKLWDMSDSSVTAENLWATFTLKATLEDVEKAISDQGYTHVYVSLVNTDDNLVICGNSEECHSLITHLGCRAIPMGFVPAIHSPPTKEEYEGIAKLYSLETENRNDIKLYSSSCYLPIPVREKSVAYAIAKCFSDPVDFPRLVNKVYEDGARIFIEAGAGRACSTWIDKILNDKEHVIIPLNAKGTDDHLTFTRVLAKLFCHKVNVNLHPLYANVS